MVMNARLPRPSDEARPHIDALTLACFGALSRDMQHESNNLLAIAGAWTGYQDRDVASLMPLLEMSSNAVTRLTKISKALSLCALHKNGAQRNDSLATIFEHAVTLCAPRLRVAAVTMIGDIPDIQTVFATSALVLATSLVLRHATEAAATTNDRKITTTCHRRPSSSSGDSAVELVIQHSSEASIDERFVTSASDPVEANFWRQTGLFVANHWLEQGGGSLTFEIEEPGSCRCLLMIPCLPN